ncbi:MAG: hypothetical protein H6607_05685 [Flavobacteriales bacterium]|nr:hypothetical protein [Flavobacteriales bacterium]
MRFQFFLPALLFFNLCFGQKVLDYKAFDKLEVTIPDQKYQKGYRHDMKVLATFEKVVVVQEIAISMNTSSESETNKSLHFIDKKTGKEIAKYFIIYSTDDVTNSLDKNIIDFSNFRNPSIVCSKNKIILSAMPTDKISNNVEHEEVIRIIVLTIDDLKVSISQHSIGGYSKYNRLSLFEMKLSVDSNFIMFRESIFKSKDEAKKYYSAIRIFDLNLEEIGYLLTHNRHNFIGFNHHILTFETSDQPLYINESKFSNSSLMLKLYDFENRTERSKIVEGCVGYKNYQNYSNSMPPINFVLKNTGELHFVSYLSKSDKSPSETEFILFKVILDDSESNLFEKNALEVSNFRENPDGDQHEFQSSYLSYFKDLNLENFSTSTEEIKPLQNYKQGMLTLQFPVKRGMFSVIACPTILYYPEYNNKMVLVHRVMNETRYNHVLDPDYHRPLIVQVDEGSVYMLGNFTVPTEKSGKTYTMSAQNPQVLQLIRVDFDDQEITRENVAGTFEKSEENNLFDVDPDRALLEGDSIYCVMKTPAGEYKLCRINLNID